jgi:hypothetical protein
MLYKLFTFLLDHFNLLRGLCLQVNCTLWILWEMYIIISTDDKLNICGNFLKVSIMEEKKSGIHVCSESQINTSDRYRFYLNTDCYLHGYSTNTIIQWRHHDYDVITIMTSSQLWRHIQERSYYVMSHKSQHPPTAAMNTMHTQKYNNVLRLSTQYFHI